jgi:hypothetical protein
MAKPPKRDPKREALARDGALNPHPEAIHDALFTGNPFFDAEDLVQVRYEMVRRHRVDGVAISEVSTNFGVSRPTFYKALRAPQDLCRGRCLCGCAQGRKAKADNLAMSRGDRGAVWHQGSSAELGARAGAQKKTNQSALTNAAASKVADAYESLRAAALCAEPAACPGLGILRRQGMAAWMRALERPPHSDGDRHPMIARLPASDAPQQSTELTRLIASIIVSVGTEHAHA